MTKTEQGHGKHLAEHRKVQAPNQARLRELVGVFQQQIGSIEIGRRHILCLLAAADHDVETQYRSVDRASGEEASKRGPAPKLQQQLEGITRVPKAHQRFAMQMIDTVLQQ